MASPRAIAKLARLAPPSPKIDHTTRLFSIQKTPVRRDLSVDRTNKRHELSVPTLCPFNVDTPNRLKILNRGFSNCSATILGHGSYGTVVEASYKGDQVAAKIVQRRKNSDQSIHVEKHAAFLRHKNIVKVLGIEQGPALSLITMELCGESLQETLERRRLTYGERIHILEAIVQALDFCHRAGVVHADIKPKNILMAADGQPKLADFGSSVLIHESKTYKRIPGTPGYAAPEVLRGEIPSPAADVYSAGVVAWQMLSQQAPFADLHPHTILYLTGKGITPSDEEYEDNLNGVYKALYRRMWLFSKDDRPTISGIIESLTAMKIPVP